MRRALAIGLTFVLVPVIGCVALPTTRSEPARRPAPETAASAATPAQAARVDPHVVAVILQPRAQVGDEPVVGRRVRDEDPGHQRPPLALAVGDST